MRRPAEDTIAQRTIECTKPQIWKNSEGIWRSLNEKFSFATAASAKAAGAQAPLQILRCGGAASRPVRLEKEAETARSPCLDAPLQ